MSVYYPQAVVTLRILFEDFNSKSVAALQKVYSLPILARKVTVNINDYSQADTFDAEIDYKQFPFDPRSIRACGVTISMADMKTLFRTSNELVVMKPRPEDNLFIGFADEESISFDENSRSVRLEGRDLTSLLIDRICLTGAVDMTKTIDVILNQFLSELAEFASIQLDNRVLGALPVLAGFFSLGSTAPNMGSRRNTKKDESYWDVIQDIAASAGLIAYMELDKLVLSNPRTLYSSNSVAKFAYGRNIKGLNFKRQIGRKKNFNIAVRSGEYLENKEPISVEIPKEATAEWANDIGIQVKRVQVPVMNADGTPGEPRDAPIMSFLVANIKDRDHLIAIGQKIYEELGRQQIEGSFTTKDLETDNGTSTCYSLMQLRNGTPVSIQIDQGDLAGINKINSESDKAKFLKDRCYENSVADVLAKTLSNKRFQSPFYTKAVQFTIDSESGVEIKVDFLNFIDLPKDLL